MKNNELLQNDTNEELHKHIKRYILFLFPIIVTTSLILIVLVIIFLIKIILAFN